MCTECRAELDDLTICANVLSMLAQHLRLILHSMKNYSVFGECSHEMPYLCSSTVLEGATTFMKDIKTSAFKHYIMRKLCYTVWFISILPYTFLSMASLTSTI